MGNWKDLLACCWDGHEWWSWQKHINKQTWFVTTNPAIYFRRDLAKCSLAVAKAWLMVWGRGKRWSVKATTKLLSSYAKYEKKVTYLLGKGNRSVHTIRCNFTGNRVRISFQYDPGFFFKQKLHILFNFAYIEVEQSAVKQSSHPFVIIKNKSFLDVALNRDILYIAIMK